MGMTDSTPATAASGCTDEHAKFCSDCTTARAYNSIHCQDCGEGRPSAATPAATDDEREMEQWEPDIIEKSGKPEDYMTDSTPATAAPLQPWAIVCPDGLPFRHYATEREAATVAAKIDVGGQMYPFHAMHCGPHTVEKVA